jgi:hypothetical protein
MRARGVASAPTRVAWHLLAVVGFRLAVSVLVLGCGLTAITDDDYHRLVISLGFAEAPSLSLINGSWLPLPFLVYGGLFSLFGPSLVAAHTLGVLSGVLSTLALWDAARRMGGTMLQATLSVVVLTAVPQVAVHGAVTVPEFPAHAAAFWAVAVFFDRAAARTPTLLACLAAMLATLCRYETWPIALVVALYAARRGSAWQRVVGPLLAGSGIFLWLSYWYATTGNALGFAADLAPYRVALGQAGDPLLWKLARFPVLALVTAPELALVTLVALWKQRLPEVRAQVRSLLRHLGPSSLCLLLFLVVSDLRDTMATHHLERPLLFIIILRGCIAGFLLAGLLCTPARRRAFVVPALLAIPLGLVARPLVPHYTWYHPRPEEVRLGRWLAERLPKEHRIAVEAPGYGHFAIVAGLGAPSRMTLLFEADARLKEPELDDDAWLKKLKARAGFLQVRWVVVPSHREAALAHWARVQHRTDHYVVAELPRQAR